MAGLNKGRRRLLGEMNVVPYIDVMLVLVVIFMITAPLIQQGMQVQLPQANSDPLASGQAGRSITLTVAGDGDLYLEVQGDDSRNPEPTPMDAQAIREAVSQILQESPGTPVYVQGDAHVPYDHVIQAMALLKEAGAPSVGLVTEPPPETR
jgi:biopolymer transport protein TolR